MDIISKILNAFSKPVKVTKTQDALFFELYVYTYCLGHLMGSCSYWIAINNVVFDEWLIHVVDAKGSMIDLGLQRDKAVVKAYSYKDDSIESLTAKSTTICKRLQIAL